MSNENENLQYLMARTEAGLLIIHSSPITLSWVPHDIINNVYNVGGMVTVGTFESPEEAKRAGTEQYSVKAEDWLVSDTLPFDTGRNTQSEVHTPDIDGHRVVRHGIRWK